jgi:peptidoglycan hydrolase CwlO-like protein
MTTSNRAAILIEKIEEQQATMKRLSKEFNDHTRDANRIQFEVEKMRRECDKNQIELEKLTRELEEVPTLHRQKEIA